MTWTSFDRERAIRALGAIGPAAAEALPVLTEALDAHELRIEAAKAVGRIGATPAVVAKLVDILEAHPSTECAVITRGPARIPGTSGGTVGPGTTVQTGNAEGQIRIAVAQGLAVMGDGAALAVPALSRALADLDPLVRHEIAAALLAISQDPAIRAQAIGTLREDLTASGDWSIRHKMVEALASLGLEATPARAALQARAEDEEEAPEVRAAARAALEVIAGH